MLDLIEKDIEGDWNLLKAQEETKNTAEFYSTINNLMNTMIYMNKKNRRKERCDLIGLQAFLREYCTVKINLGRQTGKTNYIIDRAGENDIVLVDSSRMKRHIIMTYRYKNKGSSPKFQIISFADNPNVPMDGFENIWIDDYSFFIDNRIEHRIYSYLGVNTDQTFIFLG